MPTRYGSVFRPACFALEGIKVPAGVDMEIRAVAGNELLGVKRMYSSGSASVNVAPYVRRLLRPAPMCGNAAGVHVGTARVASCFIAATDFRSDTVTLCAGTEDASENTLLSAAPHAVKIAPGEKDEMSVISGDRVVAEVIFRRVETSYTEIFGQRNAAGMLAAVVDADEMCRIYASRTGGAPTEPTDFTVRLKLEQTGFEDRVIERKYILDRGVRKGRRLAWVNRYGSVDYHTFPVCEEFRSKGGHTRIETSAGYRTVATAGVQSLKLSSEPCDELTAEWLSELFSSPAVWMVYGSQFERVDVAAGEVVCSPLQPSTVSVVVSAATPSVSRKF